MEYIEIGQIVNTNGLKGVVKVNSFTDDISKFEDLKYVYIQLKNELKKGYDIVFLWNKKSKIKYDCFFDIKQEIRDCFEEAQLLEKK